MSESPTGSRPISAEDTTVSTFQYVSPEQLEGKDADARADLRACGCVLYEMATGKRAIEGTSQARLIAANLKETPRPRLTRRDLVTGAVARDGVRMLLSSEQGGTPPPHIQLIVNRAAALKGR